MAFLGHHWPLLPTLDLSPASGKHDDGLAPWAIVGYVIASGGGVAYSLSAATGTYSLTGTASTLTTGRVLPLDTGSYTLTGEAATLTTGRNLTLAAGSYTLTGTAAVLAKGYVLSAAAGTYSVTGQTLTPQVSRSLALATGSYTITGSAATFSTSVTVIVRSLALSWSATPPALLWSGVAVAVSWSAVGPQLTWNYGMAQRQNFTLYLGEDSLCTFTQTVSAQNIAGWTFRVKIWPWASNFTGTPTVDSASEASIVFTITDAAAGVFTMLLPAAVTALLTPAGLYGYEVRRIDAGANTMLAWGQLTVGEYTTQAGA